MSKFSGKRCVWALIAACLLGAAVAHASESERTPRNSPEALRDFGVEESEPIESGFFFYAGKYVEMPYVVERRGLDIFINRHCVRPGPEYPPFVYDVSKDPGDPPPGSSPFDPAPEGTDRRNTYWRRKSAYLRAHYDHSTYVKKMIETYLKSTEVTSVEPHPDFSGTYVVTLKDGRTKNVGFYSGGKTEPQDKESYLRGARRSMEHFAKGLRGGGLFFSEVGAEVSVGMRSAPDIIGALLSSEDPEVRLENVLKLGIAPGKSDKAFWQRIATEFEPSEQLRARYERLEALRDFRTGGGLPIESGFFFYAGKYVEMPYVVERRGLDIFINGRCVRRGPEYPPFEGNVSEDPGDPPPGSSPFDRPPEGTDRRDTYWAKKRAYLRAHYDDSACVKKMIENYLKSTEITSVEPHPKFSGFYIVTFKDGHTANISFILRMPTGPRNKESLLYEAKRSMLYFEEHLHAGGLFFIGRGSELSVASRDAPGVVEALLSSGDPQVRLENLEKAGFVPRSDRAFWQVIATEFEPSEQLKARCEAAKAEEREGKKAAVAVPQWKATLPSGVTVELVGVSYHPSEGKQWWRPDGSALGVVPYKNLRAHVRGDKTWEFAVQTSGFSGGIHSTRWKFEPRGFSTGVGARVRDGRGVIGLRGTAIAASIPDAVDSCNLRFGVAGPWAKAAYCGARGAETVTGEVGDIIFSEVQQVGGGVRISVSDDLPDGERRVVAIDKGGQTHVPSGTDVSSAGDLQVITADFSDLTLDQVLGFEFRTRSIEWVQFRNVSLEPGHKTDVEVVVEPVGHAAWGEAVEGVTSPTRQPMTTAAICRSRSSRWRWSSGSCPPIPRLLRLTH